MLVSFPPTSPSIGLDSAFAGLLTGLSLIVAIGAQNAYLLRQGLRRSHVGPVVAVCALSDFILIVAGVSGIGVIVTHAGWALVVVRWLGAAFLTWYGLSSAWRARRPAAGLAASRPGQAGSAGSVVRRAVALTWLNPHVYLDTVLLLGSVAAGYGTHRWLFAVGAGAASVLWFSGLGFGARFARPVFARPAAWRLLDSAIAVIMILIGVRMATLG